MRFRTIGKVLLVLAMLIGTIVGMWYAVAFIMFGASWWDRLIGLGIMGAGIVVFVVALDISLGRPPQFSARPWERPWEDRP